MGSLNYNSLILKESNVQNALASTIGKRRYVLYSATFLEKFKSDAQTEAGATPSAATIEAIGAYNESLVRSGAFVAAEGLHPSSQGVRMALTDGERSLVRGPFPNPDQIIAGYWLVDAPSLADAVALAQRCPFEKCGAAGEIEVRPLESNEAPPDVPTPAGPDGKPLPPSWRERWRSTISDSVWS